MLIVIEGPDGSGKTTLLNTLKERFGMFKYITPFDTEYGVMVKKILTDPYSKGINNSTKADLMSRCIRSTYDEIIAKDLTDIFITDRWSPSFYVYQQASTDLDVSACHRQYFDYMVGSLVRPRYSYYLETDSETLTNRITSRNTIDELDKYAISSMDKIVKEYIQFREIYDDRPYYEVLDASKSPLELADQVTKYLRTLLV